MGLIIGGKVIEVPGHSVVSWRDSPKHRLRMGEDGGRRTEKWVRSIILHTTMGLPARYLPGRGLSMGGDTVLCWSLNHKQHAGAHLVVDMDGTIYCCADLQLEQAYHATSVNAVSIGIEMRQGHAHGELYEEQVETTADLVVELCLLFKIFPQCHYPYLGGPVPRLAGDGHDCVGIFGHRDQTSRKPRGDPGDQIFDVLLSRGFGAWDFSQDEDLKTWRERQRRLNAAGWVPALTVDGIPGPKTWAAWSALGDQTHDGCAERRSL